MKRFKDKHIVLGVTGGIAAYKSATLASMLQKAEALVDVVMTPAAQEFITPLTFSTLTKRDVHTEMFGTFEHKPEHISLAESADLVLVAPATANIIAKYTHGLADNLLLTTLLATRAPVLVAPAMNCNMWSHPATLDNIHLLNERGVHFVGPAEGMLACGSAGMGRMSEPDEIFHAALELFDHQQG